MREALWLVLDTAGSLLATVCLLRVWLVWAGTGLRDPVGHFVCALTDWIVKPLRTILPVRPRLDWASLFAAVVVTVFLAVAYVLMFSMRTPSFGAVVLLAFAWLGRWALWMLIAVLVLQAILSWVNPYAPIAPMLRLLTNPLLEPVRRRLPRVGGVDLSPLVLIVLAQVGLMLLQSLPGLR